MDQPALRVLVVDDDPIIRALLSIDLDRAGYAVRCASDGLAAMQTFAAFAPDIVVTDNQMPSMSGIELLDWLATVEHRVPAIMVSGDDTVRTQALAAGAAAFLAKPISREELRDEVARVARDRRAAAG